MISSTPLSHPLIRGLLSLPYFFIRRLKLTVERERERAMLWHVTAKSEFHIMKHTHTPVWCRKCVPHVPPQPLVGKMHTRIIRTLLLCGDSLTTNKTNTTMTNSNIYIKLFYLRELCYYRTTAALTKTHLHQGYWRRSIKIRAHSRTETVIVVTQTAAGGQDWISTYFWKMFQNLRLYEMSQHPKISLILYLLERQGY